jgi:cystathionine beta-lyase
MIFDFDTVPARLGSDSEKWQKYAGSDILPMWVADMDFRAPPAVLDALRRRVEHGIFGYARPTREVVDAVVGALHARHGWDISPEWIVWLPGLVVGLNVTALAFAGPGEQVLCNTPVYQPFMTAATHHGRVSTAVPLALNSAARRWEIDFDAMERAVAAGGSGGSGAGRARLFFLCNPHNPVARVFRREELLRLGEFCLRHKIILCSDEIHCDLILDETLRHVPAATLGGEIAGNTITLMAPSKTYNVPGLCMSFAVISNPKLRQVFSRAARGIVAEVSAPGFAACAAAYRDSEPWRQALLAYLRGNRDRIAEFVARELPAGGITIEAAHEATYLAWLNAGALGLDDAEKHFAKHGVGLSGGASFGANRGTHVRLNFGCPRATLDEALRRMGKAVVGN